MKKHTKSSDGLYHIGKHTYPLLEGSRAQVWHGTAYQTSGDLNKKDLYQNKHGDIVSLKKHKTAKKEKRLLKHGYGTKKGKFGAVKVSVKGGTINYNLSPSGIDGQGITDYSDDVSDVTGAALNAGGAKKTHKRRGGSTIHPLSPAGIDGQGITNYSEHDGTVGLQIAAGFASGGAKKTHRKRGGTINYNLSPSGIDGQGITDYSDDVSDVTGAALNAAAGGKKPMPKYARDTRYPPKNPPRLVGKNPV